MLLGKTKETASAIADLRGPIPLDIMTLCTLVLQSDFLRAASIPGPDTMLTTQALPSLFWYEDKEDRFLFFLAVTKI